ncbi:MAG: hypothetical protein HPY60_08025 [Candidatus Methanofastidiosum sp.]|nr:hypothetical protein [Methanofastidiosum sp.]
MDIRNILLILQKKWYLFFKVLPILGLIVLIKLIFHYIGFETISLNSLFTSLVGGTIFLFGFLISGVLSDYKESEKIPGDIACSLEAIHDETSIICLSKNSKVAKEFLIFQLKFLESIQNWLYKKEEIDTVYNNLNEMNNYFLEFESLTQANFIARMKQEQNNLRKLITRINVISSTSFIQSAYAIAEALAFFLIIGLLVLKIEPFYEALFFVILVSFLVIYMILLIRDLDDPFEYSNNGEFGSEISLAPIKNLEKRIKDNLTKLDINY